MRAQDLDSPLAVDLFAGAGGMGFGLRKAGFKVGLAVEHDRDAAQTYRFNNPGVPVVEANISRLDAQEMLKFLGRAPDVVCAGPPCQSFSAAGLRRARDPRHALFRHVLRAAEALKPRVVVIENVPGIARRVAKRDYKAIIIEALGADFDVEVHLLEAINYGVPQQRKRYFFFGRRRGMDAIGEPRRTHRPITDGGSLPATPTVSDSLRVLPPRGNGSANDTYCLSNGDIIHNLATMKHCPSVISKISRIVAGEGPISYRRLSPVYANTVIAGHRALPVHPTRNRTLSVREAACVQGFPVNYIFLGPRSNQPLQVANAVPPPMAIAIGHAVRRHLRQTG